MIRTLDYAVTFPLTGRSLSANVTFEKGLGAIVGPNESGKSTILEMIRFCLFGTSALRGRGDDYRKLKATLAFAVRGVDYRVVRAINQARLLRGGDEIAVGVRPVNAKIVEILGFGLDVFDVSCVANQGDIESLVAMKPTERKRLVDSVIGMSAIEELAKWAGEEAAVHRRDAEALRRVLVAPLAPQTPGDYVATADLKERIAVARAEEARHHHLAGRLAVQRTEPVAPVKPAGYLPSEVAKRELDAENRMRADLAAARARLAKIPPAPDVTASALDDMLVAHDLNDALVEYETWVRRHPPPRFSVEQETAIEVAWERHAHGQQTADLLRRRARHLADGVLTCPACQHAWPVAHDHIADIDAALAGRDRTCDGAPRPATTLGEVEVSRDDRLRLQAAQATAPVRPDAVPPRPDLSRGDIARARAAIEGAGERVGLAAEIASLAAKLDGVNFEPVYRASLAYEAARQGFDVAHHEWTLWLAERAALIAEFEGLRGAPERVAALAELHQRCAAYEAAMEAYAVAAEAHAARMARVMELQAEDDGWMAVREALLGLRKTIKQHLLPSLNRVASHLLKGMTGGERQSIVVDDDFDVAVDGQPLATLSGSGKAVACLSLRLALGQVLTNGVFSVFMGDEIDGSMDERRSAFTTGTFRSLNGAISQILLVTHKSPEADYTVDLGRELVGA